MSRGVGHIAFVGVIVICLFLAGACGAFCRLGSVAMACLLLLVVLLTLLMLTGLTGCAYLAMVVLWGDEKRLVFECAALASSICKPVHKQH